MQSERHVQRNASRDVCYEKAGQHVENQLNEH